MPYRLLHPGVLLILLLLAIMPASQAADHAVALVYHHVSDSLPAATSVSPRQFEAQLEFLERNQFNVWSLGKILQALRRGEAIPDNTVAITFDDASVTVFSEVFPRLRVLGWPFTVFVNTEAVERGYGTSMSWSQLRQIAKAGNEIGNHSHAHAHMIRLAQNESAAAWKRRVTNDIKTAQSLIKSNTGFTPRLFAYPYGEHSSTLRAVIDELGLTGIAQQSGAIGRSSDYLVIPRFPVASRHGSLSRLATAVRSRPLPVIATEMPGVEDYNSDPDWLTLTLAESQYRSSQLACYSAGGDRLQLSQLSESPLTIQIDLQGQTNPGRNKVNCTAPATDESKAFYWYSYLWMSKQDDGSWYRE